MGLLSAVTAGKRISTRKPSSAASKGEKFTDELYIGREAIEQTPRQFDINADFVSRYSTVKTGAKTSAGKADAFTAEAVDNLIWLYNNAPDAVKNVGKNWYVGANKIAQNLAKEYNVSHETASAVLAALSPQKDWYQNVSLAERVLSSYTKAGSNVLDADAFKLAKKLYKKPKYGDDLKALKTKPFDQLTDIQKAMYIRSYDQKYNDRGYQIINPNGDMMGQAFSEKTGNPLKTAWGSNSEIAKAIRVIEDPSIENISEQMGGAHKVRNFFNNISNPTYAIDNPEIADVTIDTHAVAADQLSPLSQKAVEVGAAFGTQKGVASAAGTGARGTYGLHADAYRIAARELGIQPRELQSVTWETVRLLYPASFKASASNVDEINQIWNLYNKGKITKGLARELILDKAGGIPDPDWAKGRSGGLLDLQGSGSQSGQLPVSGVSGGQGGGRSNAGRTLLSAGLPTAILTTLGISTSPETEAGVVTGVKNTVTGLLGKADEVAAGRGALQGAEGQTFLRPQDEITARVYDSLRSQLPRYGEAVYDQVPVGENAGILSRSGASGITRFRMPEEYAGQLSEIGRASPDLIEIKPDSAGTKLFADSMQRSKEGNKYGASVYVYPQDEYKNMRLFMTEDGTAGYALKPDGDVVSAFSYGPHKGVAQNILLHAIEQGGTKLDAFDTVLPDLYSTMGFREGGRLRWDDSQAPEDWSKETFGAFNRGEPDVSFMGYDPRPSVPVRPNYVETYDDALQAQQGLIDQAANAGKLRNVFPAPQRFFDPEDKAFKPFLGQQFEPQAGGRYLQMGDGAPKDITGEYPNYGLLSVSPEGKPAFQVSDAPAEAGAKTGRKIKTNLFKRKAGWKWTQAPEGFDPDPAGDFPLISVQDGKQHYYTLSTEFPEGVELTRYEKSATEPRLRPTRQGAVELGNVVGEISVRGKKHPVYDRATVRNVIGAGITVGTVGLTVGSRDVDASLLGVGSTIGKKAEDMLGMAMTMRDRGVDSAEIWNKTGWEFNEVDGRWRTEHNNYDNTKITMPEEAGTYKFWDLVDDPVLRGAYDSDSSGRVIDMYGLQSAGGTPFESLQVEITPYLPPNDAEIRGPFIRVGEGTSPDEFRKTLLHELQHVIQQRENFATGGNTDMFRDRRDMFGNGEFEARMGALTERVRLANDFVNNPPESATFDQIRQAYQILETDGARIEAMRAYERDSLQGRRSPFQMYEAMTGEVEARNIEERDQPLSSMREFSPEATEDARFPRGQQIALDESRSPYYDEDYNKVNFRSSAPDMNYPRQVTVGEAKTPEANYSLLDALVPAVAAAYDYGDGANFPVRPAQGLLAPEPKPETKPEPMKLDTTMVPAGVPINPYTFMMSTGADQGEAARYAADAYTNIGRGVGNAIGGVGGEMETLGKGLMYALAGQGLGGSPWGRLMHVLDKYNPQLPNTQDVGRLPALLPNVSPMTEEERRMHQLAGETIASFYLP